MRIQHLCCLKVEFSNLNRTSIQGVIVPKETMNAKISISGEVIASRLNNTFRFGQWKTSVRTNIARASSTPGSVSTRVQPSH